MVWADSIISHTYFRDYLVLESYRDDQWYIGWVSEDVAGVSRIPVKGPVRVLLGSKSVYFIGFSEEGEQIEIMVRGHGCLGKKGAFSRVPLM
jgi:hypothetical protein